MPEILYAHTGSNPDDCATWQTLADHLNNVADLAAFFTNKFGMSPYGRVLGLLHDAGKASHAFQKRLHGNSHHVDHSTAGAKVALDKYGDMLGFYLGYCIAGHHSGQPNGIGGESPSLEKRIRRDIEPYSAFNTLVETGEITLPSEENFASPLIPNRKFSDIAETRKQSLAFSLYVLNRMLYSSLVDADYLDTETHMRSDLAQIRNQNTYATLQQLLGSLDKKLAEFKANDSFVNKARQSVLLDCIQAAKLPQGLFTLTVPTGGGKTLSSLAFALRHALLNNMERIIVAIPFVSIVEQTAAVLKEIFGAENVLEHHSNYDFVDIDDENEASDLAQKHRLTTQNWDAPIIVTTNVQLFESLFANRPGKSRKIHNIANSVVILDEAQTLPDPLLTPTLAMLEELSFAYNTSVVLCSATQPALDMQWAFGSSPQEIITHTELFDVAFGSRVTYEMLGDLDSDQLINFLVNQKQALCIVGTKDEARQIYDSVVDHYFDDGALVDKNLASQKGIFHLSASMTPQHRSSTIKAIRKRLKEHDACLVISTQLIEAGVDIDFPVVFRELAGMDSIVQAAGRCNREGRQECGQIKVFEYSVDGERQKSTDWLEKMKMISRDLIRQNCGVIDGSLILPFFEKRYRTEETDAKDIFKHLSAESIIDEEEGIRTIPFEQVARDYCIIDDDSVPLFIPWGDQARELLKELLASDNQGALAMRLQQYSISVPRYKIQDYKDAESVMEVGPFLVLREERVPSLYQEDVGLINPADEKQQALFF